MDITFYHLREDLQINTVKKIVDTDTRTGINSAKKFGDKYGKK